MASKRNTPMTCIACGKDFLAYPDQVKRGGGKFCSRTCANRTLAIVQQGENHPMYKGGPEMVLRTCEMCGKEFSALATSVKYGNARLCSLECQRASIYAARATRHQHFMENFWSHLDMSGGPDACWTWTGKTNAGGYGFVFNLLMHRVAYELTNGPIPEGLDILHSCDNPPCCNPAHLRPGTQRDNTQDMVERDRYISGEAHPGAKLTWQDTEAIRAAYASGIPQTTIAKQYGVVQGTISRITRGAGWVKPPNP